MIWKDDGMDLQALVKLARQIGFFDVFVFTNGTIPLSIRDCNYIVTIDGPREIHDKIRPNTYDVIIDNVRNAVTKSVFASITFCNINGDYVTQFVKETTALNVFKGISFNLLTHWPEIVSRHGIMGNARINVLDSLWKLKHEGYPILLSKAAYIAMRNNNWKRPIPQIELATNTKIYKCCRDVDKPIVCEQCGYVNCVEVSQILAFKPSAMAQVLKML